MLSTIRGMLVHGYLGAMTVQELASMLDRLRPPGVNQSEWARRSGYTPTLIADFKNHGKNITIAAFLRLAEAIGVRVVLVPASEDPLAVLPLDERACLDAFRAMTPLDRSTALAVLRALPHASLRDKDLVVRLLDEMQADVATTAGA